jgi:excisionase family DNA binding protein
MANRRILTISELAAYLNIHKITIYRLLKNGNLPGFRIGRAWRFDLDQVTEWVESGKSSQSSTRSATADGAIIRATGSQSL